MSARLADPLDVWNQHFDEGLTLTISWTSLRSKVKAARLKDAIFSEFQMELPVYNLSVMT